MKTVLLLNPAEEAKWETHAETGARFRINCVTPDQHEATRRACLREDGTLNVAKWGEDYAALAITDWEGVGSGAAPAECNEANRRTFGRRQAASIMPWIVVRATALDRYRAEEETAAKNA